MSSKNRNRAYIQLPQGSKETGEKEMPNENTQEETKQEQEPLSIPDPVLEEPKAVEQVKPMVEIKEPLQKPQPQHKSGDFSPVFKVELDLNNYAEAMDKTKAITPEEGGRWQYSLFASIRATLNAVSQEEFNKEWSTILNFFNKSKEGIFNEKFIFRFPEQWPGSAGEFTIFRRVVYTIIQTADHKLRKKALADINMSMVVDGLTESQKQKLFSFYGI